MNKAISIKGGRVLRLRNYVVTSAILFAAIGFVSGVIGLVGSFRGRHVFFVLGPFHLEGVPAGILGVPLMPLVFAVAGILLALITYLPASWILRRVLKPSLRKTVS